KLDDRAIQSYVANNIKSNGYTVEGDALQELLGRVSNDLSSAMNELPKLFLYCQKDKVITKNSIDSLVAKSLDQNVFDLIDYV
ncbi:DNA polymerase III subunit delta, partial [Enterococcus lactis]